MALRSLRSWLTPVVSQHFLSRGRLLALREKAEIKRITSSPGSLLFCCARL